MACMALYHPRMLQCSLKLCTSMRLLCTCVSKRRGGLGNFRSHKKPSSVTLCARRQGTIWMWHRCSGPASKGFSFFCCQMQSAGKATLLYCQQVRPLDNLSKCRALLPSEDPESRAAHMAVKPRVKRDEVSSRPYAPAILVRFWG